MNLHLNGNRLLRIIRNESKSWFRAYIQRNLAERSYRKFRKEEHTVLYDHPIGPQSVVCDVGGYRGDWTAEIIRRYGCGAYIFEPGPEYAESLRSRFKHESDVVIVEAGLSDKNCTAEFVDLADGSQARKLDAFNDAIVEPVKAVQLLDALEAIAGCGDEIDLLKCNIEGGEFTVLPRLYPLFRTGAIKRLLVQFHSFVDEADEQRSRIVEDLASFGYQKTYSAPFVWEIFSAPSSNMSDVVGNQA